MASKRPLKVCMITPHFPPEFGWYGPGRDSMELALELAERGHQVEVIACADKLGAGETYQDGIKVIRISLPKYGPSDSLIAHSLPKARLLMNINMAFWEAFLRASKNTEYDVVDASGFSAESLIPSLLSDCPVVARVHDRSPEFLEKELASIGESVFKFEQRLVNSLRSITSNCASSRTIIGNAQLANETENSGQLNYSLDTDSFSPQGLLAIDTQDRPSLLVHTSIGNEKYKNLVSDVITRVKAKIPDLWLTIVAHDIYSEGSEEKTKEALAAAGIVCDMVINHNMSRLLMPGLWRSCWCGLILDWQDLAPYAVLEPLACGKSIVAEAEFTNLDFLKDREFLLTPKEFSATLVSEKLVTLLQDEKQRQTLGTKAREYILANHSRKDNGALLVKMYAECIEKYKIAPPRAARILHMERSLDLLRSLPGGLEQWLYDLLFVHSFRFRVSHWLKKIRNAKAAKRKERP